MVAIKKVSPSTIKSFKEFCSWCDSNLELTLPQRFYIDAAETMLLTPRGKGQRVLFQRWFGYPSLWETANDNQKCRNGKAHGIKLLLSLLSEHGDAAGFSAVRIKRIKELMRK